MSHKQIKSILGVAAAITLGLGSFAGLQAQQMVAYDAVLNATVADSSNVKHVLLYNYSLGGHTKTYILNSLRRTAVKYGFQLDTTTKNTYITAATLAGVDVAVFNNGDGDVLSNSTSLTAMKNFVQTEGKGLLQTHAAAAYVPCPTSGTENLTDANCRWLARVLVRQYKEHDPAPTKARMYVDSTLAGQIPPGATGTGAVAALINHGKTNPETRPIFEGLPVNGTNTDPTQVGVWDSLPDEWYDWRGYVRQQGAQTLDGVEYSAINVLLSLDESKCCLSATYKMGDRSESWGRKVGNGLTVYNNMGHTDIYAAARGTRNGVAIRDSMPEKYNWRVMRYLARDFVGCTDVRYQEYRSRYSVEALTPIDTTGAKAPFNALLGRKSPCLNLKQVAVSFVKGQAILPGIRVAGNMIQIPTSENGSYKVIVTNALGKQVFARNTVGAAGKMLTVPALSKGTYFVRVSTPLSGEAVAKLSL